MTILSQALIMFLRGLYICVVNKTYGGVVELPKVVEVDDTIKPVKQLLNIVLKI